MRLPRMTTRRWMVAVAILAVTISVERTRRRWTFYREQAASHAASEAVCQGYADAFRGVSGEEDRVEQGDTLATYHALLRRKYEHAAAHPWESVPPDPPEP